MSPRALPARRFRAVLLGALLATIPAMPGRAQIVQPASEGLKFGHFLLFPSLSLEYTHDSNIFYGSSDQPENISPSGIMVVRPRIMVDLPLSDSRIRWSYSPFYRDYTSQDFTGSNRINHVFDLESRFRAHSPLTISVRDHFLRGTISLQEQTTANGLSFGLGRYSAHNPALEIGLSLGARQGISLIPSYARTSFTGIDGSLQYTFSTRRIEGRYNYKLSEPTTFYGYYAYEANDQSQVGSEDVRFYTRAAGLGVTRTLNQAIVTQMSAGYQTMEFQGTTGQDFSGPVLDGAATWLVSDGARVEFGILRHPYASIYVDNNYYIDTESRLRLTLQAGPSSYVDVGAAALRNVYAPDVGARRRDRMIRFEVGLGHQFLRTLRGYVGATSENRRSNIEQTIGTEEVDPFRIRVNRLVFRLEAGWM